jgi:hypothetical protein
MKRLKCAGALSLLFSLAAIAAPTDDEGWIPLFNGKNLDGWYSFQPTTGRNNDLRKFFKVTDGMIHVLDLSEDPHEWKGAVGYLATNQEYSDVRIHLEYKWGAKRFARSVEGKRNSGLMYLVVGPDKMFPRSLECQIEETDVGDLWLVDGVSITTWLLDPYSSMYSDDPSPPGSKRVIGGLQIPASRVLKSGDFEDRTGWNTVEVILEGDRSTHIINGRTVNRAWDIRQPDPQDPTRMIPLKSGHIALEAEGSEIWFRNIKIKLLKPVAKSEPPPPGARP